MSQKRSVVRVAFLCLLLVGWGVVQSQMKPTDIASQISAVSIQLTQNKSTVLPNPFVDTHIQLAEVTKEAALPKLLPSSEKANPIENESLQKKQRAVIDQELPHATEEEKEIWLKTFKDLPPTAIRETLRTRKMLEPLMEPLNRAVPELSSLPDTVSSGSKQTLQTAIVAMEQAEQVAMNNIANAFTFGFKRTKTSLSNLPYQRVEIPVPIIQQDASATKLEIGFGVQVDKTEIDMSQGKSKQTGRQLDIAIKGNGFISVASGDGEVLYTRNGQLSTNQDGQLTYRVVGKAFLIDPPITIPSDTTAVHISPQGIVTVEQTGSGENKITRGQIQMAKVPVPSLLKQFGGGLYALTEAAGKIEINSPGSEGFGLLQQGALECSNVNVEKEVATLKQYHKHLQTLLELQRELR